MKKGLLAFFLTVFMAVASPSKAEAASFSLDPQTLSPQKNNEFLVNLKLDTTGEMVTGVDVVFSFDKEVLEVKDVLFQQLFALNDVNINNGGGELKLFSTMNSPTSYFQGNEQLAIIKLKGKRSGEAKLTFRCQEGTTADDSNIWKKSGRDIINCSALNEGKYNIKDEGQEGDSCKVPTPPTNPKAVSGPGAGQVTLSWGKTGTADYYTIAYGRISLNYLWGAPNTGDISSFTVSGLDPGKAYYFIVAGVNECGSSGALSEVAAYAGKKKTSDTTQQEYWYPPQTNLSASASPKVTASSSASPTNWLKFSPKPTSEEAEEKSANKWAYVDWLKLIGLGLVILASIIFVVKKIKPAKSEEIPPLNS